MKALRTLGVVAITLVLGWLPAAAATGHFERTLQVSGPVDLDVVSGAGNIKVHTGPGNSIRVVAEIHGNSWWLGSGDIADRIHTIEQHPPIEQQGNMVRIGHVSDSSLMRNISIDYDLTVPAQTQLTSHTGSGDQEIDGVQLPLIVRSGSGNLTVRNIGADVRMQTGSGEQHADNLKGALNAQAGSGNITARGVGGEITATTGSGDVEITQSGHGDAHLQAGSGNLTLRGLQGGLRAHTGSGDISIEGQPTGDWRVGAGSGTIKLKVPQEYSFSIDARTHSGSLTVNRQLTMQGTLSKSHIQGKVGKGGALVDIETGSGDIVVD